LSGKLGGNQLNKYETIFVIDSLLKSDEIESIVSKYQRFISANGGQIEALEAWGKKRLAYEIKKRQYGYYVLIRFEGPATMIKQLEREYRLNESILRYMTLRMTKAALQSTADQVAQPAPPKKEPAQPETESKEEKKEETETEKVETKEAEAEAEKPAESTVAQADSEDSEEIKPEE
jgi:small subunit ribosomal protein S6